MYKYIEQGSYGGCLASERIICMEYYAKSKKVQFTSERINEIKKNMKNIEECKGRRNERLGTSGEVLIETSWNVKEKECSQYQFSEEVLIETSWNVKY